MLQVFLRIPLYVSEVIFISQWIPTWVIDVSQLENPICQAIYPISLFVLEGVI